MASETPIHESGASFFVPGQLSQSHTDFGTRSRSNGLLALGDWRLLGHQAVAVGLCALCPIKGDAK